MEQRNNEPEMIEYTDGAQQEDTQYNKPRGSMAATIAAAVAGVLVGEIPLTVWAYFTDYTGRVLYTVIPVVIGLFIVLMGGCRNKRGVIVTAVFGYIGALWGGVLSYTAGYAYASGYFPLLIYPMSFGMVERSKVISGISFSSAYIYPVIFVFIGIFIAWMIFKSGLKRK